MKDLEKAARMALEWIEAQPEPRMLGALKAITALRQALSDSVEQPAQTDPCPGCRKGGVCRTPKCGRLKLPVDHPFRSQQPAQQKPVDWEAVAADQAMTIAMMKAEQEPFCYHDGRNIVGNEFADHCDVFPLYTAPPPRKPWVELTEEDRGEIACNSGCMNADWLDFARAIEAKLKLKNT